MSNKNQPKESNKYGSRLREMTAVLRKHGITGGLTPEKLRLMRTLGASKRQILWLLVFPANCPTLFSTLKVNVGLSWVGVIMGEFLVSRAGLGYLIVYGSQVFNMDLVMASVLVLGLAAVGMYLLVLRAEAFLNHLWGVRA